MALWRKCSQCRLTLITETWTLFFPTSCTPTVLLVSTRQGTHLMFYFLEDNKQKFVTLCYITGLPSMYMNSPEM